MMSWSKSSQKLRVDNDPLLQRSEVEELRAALGPLCDRSLKFCTDACLRRYLEARNWNVDQAKKMIEETLKWRATYKPEEIRWNTSSEEGNVRHVVYLLENAILNLREGQEQMVWMIDFTGYSIKTRSSVSVKKARDIIHILQNHYPDRLAFAILYNPPRIFHAIWRTTKYFLSEKNLPKVKFVYPKNKESAEVMKSYFDVENLPKEFGGNATLEYDHEEFSRLMAEDDVKTARYWGMGI